MDSFGGLLDFYRQGGVMALDANDHAEFGPKDNPQLKEVFEAHKAIFTTYLRAAKEYQFVYAYDHEYGLYAISRTEKGAQIINTMFSGRIPVICDPQLYVKAVFANMSAVFPKQESEHEQRETPLTRDVPHTLDLKPKNPDEYRQLVMDVCRIVVATGMSSRQMQVKYGIGSTRVARYYQAVKAFDEELWRQVQVIISKRTRRPAYKLPSNWRLSKKFTVETYINNDGNALVVDNDHPEGKYRFRMFNNLGLEVRTGIYGDRNTALYQAIKDDLPCTTT